MLCVEKRTGLPTQPGKGHLDDTLLNGAFALRPTELGALGAQRDWGLLHRLDRDVSGVVLLAKSALAYDALRAAFESHKVKKTYLAVTQHPPPSPQGSCTRAVREEIRGDMKVAVCPQRGGESARTDWRTLGKIGLHTLLEVEPHSGRLHQVRVHLAAMGCPIVGDRVYRSDAPPNTGRLPRGRVPEPLLLHALRLEFPHPVTGAIVRVECSAREGFA